MPFGARVQPFGAPFGRDNFAVAGYRATRSPSAALRVPGKGGTAKVQYMIEQDRI